MDAAGVPHRPSHRPAACLDENSPRTSTSRSSPASCAPATASPATASTITPPARAGKYLPIAIDDHSRLAFAQLLPDETAHSAIAFLHAALAFVQRHGVTIQRVYSDNGSCDRAHAMRAAVAALGLKHRFTRPYTPKTTGKAERFLQTSLREWASAHAYAHSDQRSARLPFFLHNDNWHRPHHALKLRSPISRLRHPLNNLLSLHS